MKDIVDLNLNLILALDALLAEMNVTRAAERLNVTQPAMSRSLQKLREHLGDELLVRSGRGMVRTARAERIFGSLRHGLQALRRALNEETHFVPECSSRIFKLATRDVVSVWLLPALMAHVRSFAPNVSIHVVFVHQDLALQLDSGALDLAIGVGFADAPGLKQRLLVRDGWVCLARKGHAALAGGLGIQQFVALPHALCSPHGEGAGIVDEALAKLGYTRHIAFRTLYFIGAAMAVAQTDMILTMPRRTGQHLAALLDLQMLEPPVELPAVDLVALWHERMDDDPAHSWLRRAIFSVC